MYYGGGFSNRDNKRLINGNLKGDCYIEPAQLALSQQETSIRRDINSDFLTSDLIRATRSSDE
jgi:hypothetical protein